MSKKGKKIKILKMELKKLKAKIKKLKSGIRKRRGSRPTKGKSDKEAITPAAIKAGLPQAKAKDSTQQAVRVAAVT